MDNTTRVKVGLTIWQRPGYGPKKRLRPGQISGQRRGFASDRANFRPNKGFTNARANFKQTRGFPTTRANFRANKGFHQC